MDLYCSIFSFNGLPLPRVAYAYTDAVVVQLVCGVEKGFSLYGAS